MWQPRPQMKAGGGSGRALKGERDWHCWDSFKPFVIRVHVEPCPRACRWVFVIREKVAVGSPSLQGKFNKTYLTFATRWVSQREKGQKQRGATRLLRLNQNLWKSHSDWFLLLFVTMVLMWAVTLTMMSASLLRSLVWVWINPADFIYVFFLWFIFNNQQCCISKTFFSDFTDPVFVCSAPSPS